MTRAPMLAPSGAASSRLTATTADDAWSDDTWPDDTTWNTSLSTKAFDVNLSRLRNCIVNW